MMLDTFTSIATPLVFLLPKNALRWQPSRTVAGPSETFRELVLKLGRSACKMKVGPRGGKSDFREKRQNQGLSSTGGLTAFQTMHQPQ